MPGDDACGALPPSDLAGMLPPAIPVDPVGRCGTLPPSVSDPTGPVGQSITGGPVGHLGTLPSSTFEPAILVDPGGTSPSSDLAGMLLTAIPGSPVGFGGTLSSSDSDTAGQDGPYGTDGPVGHLGTLSPSTSTSEILVDPGGMSTSSDLACILEGSRWPRGVVRIVTSGCGCARTVPDCVDSWSVAGDGCSASGHVGSHCSPRCWWSR